MLAWIAANAGTALVLGLLALAVWGSVRSLRRQRHTCGGNCAACRGCETGKRG